jgi:hypothetical protein
MLSNIRGLLQSPLPNVLMVVLPKEKVMMGSGLRGLMNGLGSTFGVSMAAIFVETQQTIHALAFSEDQNLYPMGAAEAITAVREHLPSAGEWDSLPTKAMLMVRQTMFDEAAVLACRDCYLAIAVSSLLSLAMTLFLRTSPRQRGR